MDYRSTFEGLLASLRAHPAIEITKEHLGAPIPRDDFSFNLILDHFQIRMPDTLLDLYHSMSSCVIEWKCDLGRNPQIAKLQPYDELVCGRINIHPVDELLEFDKALTAASWTDNLDEEERADLRNLRSFDGCDDDIRVGFILKDKSIGSGALHFIMRHSEGFIATGLTLDEYIERMVAYKGYQAWPYGHFFPASENRRSMMHYLNQLFG